MPTKPPLGRLTILSEEHGCALSQGAHHEHLRDSELLRPCHTAVRAPLCGSHARRRGPCRGWMSSASASASPSALKPSALSPSLSLTMRTRQRLRVLANKGVRVQPAAVAQFASDRLAMRNLSGPRSSLAWGGGRWNAITRCNHENAVTHPPELCSITTGRPI